MAHIPAFQASDESSILSARTNMANVAHLVRASGCGSEGSGFDPRHSPQNKIRPFGLILFWVDAEIEPAADFL